MACQPDLNCFPRAQYLRWCPMSSPVQSVPIGAGERKIIEELSVQIVGEMRLILNYDWCRHIGYICLYSRFFGEACNRVCQFLLCSIFVGVQFELYYQFPIGFHIYRSPIQVVGSVSYSVKDVSYSVKDLLLLKSAHSNSITQIRQFIFLWFSRINMDFSWCWGWTWGLEG
jgi:hypothetical protein